MVESREPWLVWQGEFPPVYAFRRDEVERRRARAVGERRRATASPSSPRRRPSPSGTTSLPASRCCASAAWTLDDDAARATGSCSRGSRASLEWTEEDETVTGHPRDPHKRVEALPSSRHVEVAVDGVTVASSSGPVLLFETHLPTRFYLPREDVRLDLLEPTDNTSVCPYKGRADAYWTWPGPPAIPNLAWSYSDPAPAVGAVRDRVAFYNELVDLTVDGVLQERPESPFSTAAQRPGADG